MKTKVFQQNLTTVYEDTKARPRVHSVVVKMIIVPALPPEPIPKRRVSVCVIDEFSEIT